MKSSLTARDVLADIEFELLQGSISQDELGQSIQLVRQHQNKIRSEAFQPGQKTADLRQILSKQFQINDMLITLLQEMAASIRAMQRKVEWVGQKRQSSPTDAIFASGTPLPEVAPIDEEDSLSRPTDDLFKTMRVEAVYQRMELQPATFPIPFVNGLIRRLRLGLHNLVLFYVNRLAKQQAAVNHTHADWILHLDALHRHQQEEIERLMMQIAQLQQLNSEQRGERSQHES